MASPAASSLPLHTPAAAIPSAADVAVKAGLAERAPTGELLYTTPPGGGETSFAVQRLEDGTSPSSGNDADGDAPVQRAWETATPSPSARNANAPTIGSGRSSSNGASQSGHDTGAETKDRAEEARKLYPYIRSALEADLRRQLEGKSRASRFRP
jgi:hypothetical protein